MNYCICTVMVSWNFTVIVNEFPVGMFLPMASSLCSVQKADACVSGSSIQTLG